MIAFGERRHLCCYSVGATPWEASAHSGGRVSAERWDLSVQGKFLSAARTFLNVSTGAPSDAVCRSLPGMDGVLRMRSAAGRNVFPGVSHDPAAGCRIGARGWRLDAPRMGAKRVLWSEHVGTSTKAEHAREQNMDRVPMSSPDVTDAEREVVMKALHTPVLSIGPYVQQFEQRLSAFVGARYGVAVNSGTSGLHLSVIAAGVTE